MFRRDEPKPVLYSSASRTSNSSICASLAEFCRPFRRLARSCSRSLSYLESQMSRTIKWSSSRESSPSGGSVEWKNSSTSTENATLTSGIPSKKQKEKLFHPQSRKAGQLVRTHIRKSKLEDLARKRSHKQSSQGARDFFWSRRMHS